MPGLWVGSWRLVLGRRKETLVEHFFEVGADFNRGESFACSDPYQAELLPRNSQKFRVFHAETNPMVDVCCGNCRSWRYLHGIMDLSRSRYGGKIEGHGRFVAARPAIENIIDPGIDQWMCRIAVVNVLLDANFEEEAKAYDNKEGIKKTYLDDLDERIRIAREKRCDI